VSWNYQLTDKDNSVEIQFLCTDRVVAHPNLEFRRLPATLGRSPEADVQIYDQFASRMHCEILQCQDSLVVRDLGSGNGTFVNGTQVTEAAVSPGDQVSVGASTFQIKFSRRALSRANGNGEEAFA
jgi:pSer/pThr/pTyr-binding forkhead associated (FHA) protein